MTTDTRNLPPPIAQRAVGRFIHRQRRASGMTQRVLARDICVSPGYLSAVERGQHVPRSHVCRRLISSLALAEADAAALADLVRAAAPLRRGSPEWKAIVKKAGFQPGVRATPSGEFRKGHVPWNKDRKGIHLSPATEFKPGTRHGAARRQWRDVGTVVIRKWRRHRRLYRQRWIKISDQGPASQRYVPLARYRYERINGPVPPGLFVVHANGNTLDDRLDNLILMDRAHLTRWQARTFPKMEANRKRRASQATRRRWAEHRRLKAARQSGRIPQQFPEVPQCVS